MTQTKCCPILHFGSWWGVQRSRHVRRVSGGLVSVRRHTRGIMTDSPDDVSHTGLAFVEGERTVEHAFILWRRHTNSFRRRVRLWFCMWLRRFMGTRIPGVRGHGRLEGCKGPGPSGDRGNTGFYVAVSSKKKIRTLHLLGQCYLLPTLDYTTFSFLGPRLPSRNLYDQTCKWCAKSGDMNQKSQDSIDCGTATSSSTDDDPHWNSFEHLLHDAKVDPATILAPRHCQITDRETFAALDVDGLKTVALDMGIDLSGGGMPHKREFARITTAWKKAKVTTDALQRQHGELIAMLPEDWTSVVVQFKKKYGTDLPDEELPAQACYEDFHERLSAGMLRAESLDQVISMAEAEEQERQKPDPPKQFGIHLDSKLTLQTRRRYTGTAPKNSEELRAKYEVMSNMWLLAQLRQPGRSLFSDLQPTTFSRILRQLLGKEDFGLKKELQGKFLTAPCWEHCMSYEFEFRREAYKQCRETTIGISAAWWNAYRSQQHRMMHWLQLVSMANSSSSFSASSSQMAKMQKEITDLRNEVRNRSRTPTVFQKTTTESGRRALTNSQQLALPASGSAAKAKTKGQGKGNGKRRNRAGRTQRRPPQDGIWSFEQVASRPELRNFFTPKNVNQGSSRAVVAKTSTVPGSIVALVVAAPSRTTSATVSKIASTRYPTER